MTIGDVVHAAMFSGDFPSVKSPEQLHFEQVIEEVINGDEIDLDDLSPAEFLSSGEEEEDYDNYFQIAEDLNILGDAKKKSNGSDKQRVKKTSRPEQTDEIGEPSAKKQKKMRKNEMEKETSDKEVLLEKIGDMTEVDRRAIGNFYLSLKELRKGAKITLNALTRLQELVQKYPSLDFLYKVVKPITEVMPQDPVNSLPPLLMMSAVRGSGEKYQTEKVTKICPKRFVDENGKLSHKCGAPGCPEIAVSWGKINTHIMQKHLGQSYVCSNCRKVLSSMDGLRRHMKTFHGN